MHSPDSLPIVCPNTMQYLVFTTWFSRNTWFARRSTWLVDAIREGHYSAVSNTPRISTHLAEDHVHRARNRPPHLRPSHERYAAACMPHVSHWCTELLEGQHLQALSRLMRTMPSGPAHTVH